MLPNHWNRKTSNAVHVFERNESYLAFNRQRGLLPSYSWSIQLFECSVTVQAHSPRELMLARNQLRQQIDEGIAAPALIGYERNVKFDDGVTTIWFMPPFKFKR